MPAPEFGSLNANATLPEVIDYVFKLQKELNYLLNNLDDQNVNRLTANSIKAGTLDANLVTIRSDLSGSAYIEIDGLGIRANDGFRDTFEIDSTGKAYFGGSITSDSIITGATVQTASFGRRIVLANNQLTAYDSAGNPRIQFKEIPQYDYYELWFLDSFGTQMGSISGNSGQFNIAASYGQRMVLGDDVWFGGGSQIHFQSSNTVSGLYTTSVGNHNHGIPDGTRLMTEGGGVITWTASGGHNHTVTT